MTGGRRQATSPMRTARLAGLAAASLLFVTNPSSADLAADCTQAGNLDLQIKACSIIIEDDRASEASLATAHMNRGTAYARKRRLKAALEDLDAAAGIDPQNPLIYYNRGNIHFDLDNIADAIADYSHAVELHPGFALAVFNRGLAYERSGNDKKAVADFRASLALDPSLEKRVRPHLGKLGRKP